MPRYQKTTFSQSSEQEVLLDSLDSNSQDAFYFMCAFSPLPEIEAFLQKNTSQSQLLDMGLKAACTSSRPGVCKLLLDHGADIQPLVAFIGQATAQEFLEDPTVIVSWTTEREMHDLRLRWISLKPKSQTVLTAVEGFEGPPRLPAPSILHLQASSTQFSPAQRIAWMEFDLERAENGSNINRIADIRNIEGTPLHWVVDDHSEVWENREVLLFLLECDGVDPFVRNRFGQTARDYVVEQLALGEGCLITKMREFYLFAFEALRDAEDEVLRKRRDRGGGWLGRLRGAFGYGLS